MPHHRPVTEWVVPAALSVAVVHRVCTSSLCWTRYAEAPLTAAHVRLAVSSPDPVAVKVAGAGAYTGGGGAGVKVVASQSSGAMSSYAPMSR